MTTTSRMRIDILASKPVRRLLMSPAFPLALQAMALVGVVGLAVNGLGIGPGMKADELLTLRKTNLTTLVAARSGLAGVAILFGAVLTVWAWPVA